MILALRALGLGDLLTAVPAIRALGRATADEPLVLAVPHPLHALVAWAGLADRVVEVESAVARPLTSAIHPGAPVRIAVNLHGQGPQSTDALRRLHPRHLWSYGIPGAPVWDPDEHEIVRWCRLVEHHGCHADPTNLYVRGRTGPGEGVLIHPGAAGPWRRWPPDRFAAVARALAGRGQRVTVTAGPGEEDLAAAVAAGAHDPAVTVALGMDLVTLARRVAGSALVVCGDTGVAHLATALRTPSVVLFGPESPARWGPPSLPRHVALWCPTARPEQPGNTHPALQRLSVADVLAAATSLLDADDALLAMDAAPGSLPAASQCVPATTSGSRRQSSAGRSASPGR